MNLKAIFLPIDDRILNLFTGFIYNNKVLDGVKRSQVYTDIKYMCFYEPPTKKQRIIRVIVVLPIAPFFLLGHLIAAILNRYVWITSKMKYYLDRYVNLFWNIQYEDRVKRYIYEKYSHAEEEDVPKFLQLSKQSNAKVILYSYSVLQREEQDRVDELLSKQLIASCHVVNKLSDLSAVVEKDNIDLSTSFLVIKDPSELEQAKELGIDTSHKLMKHLELWKKRDLSGKSMLEWNSKETLISMKEHIIDPTSLPTLEENNYRAKQTGVLDTSLIS